MIKILLSDVISSNRLFATGRKKRLKSKAYAVWLHQSLGELQEQGLKRKGGVRGRYSLSIEVPLRRKQDGTVSGIQKDIDNCTKAITDLLVLYGLTDDDRYQVGKYARHHGGTGVIIRIWQEGDIPEESAFWDTITAISTTAISTTAGQSANKGRYNEQTA